MTGSWTACWANLPSYKPLLRVALKPCFVYLALDLWAYVSYLTRPVGLCPVSLATSLTAHL